MSNIKLFESRQVRSQRDEKEQQGYFSVVDVVAILTDSPDAKDYWYRMKKREKLSGIELSTIWRQLKMESRMARNTIQIVPIQQIEFLYL